MPAFIATINKHVTTTEARFWVSVLLCACIGIIVNLVEHNGFPGYMGLTWVQVVDSFATTFLAIFGMTKITYEGVWNNTRIPGMDGSPLQTLDLKK